MTQGDDWIGREVGVEVEMPSWSFTKYRPNGEVDFRSPLPCPWNYGFVIGERGGDGDPLDAVLMGARRARGDRKSVVVRGVVHFVDGGERDDKLICSTESLTEAQRRQVELFFLFYTQLKRFIGVSRRLQGRRHQMGWTGVASVSWESPRP